MKTEPHVALTHIVALSLLFAALTLAAAEDPSLVASWPFEKQLGDAVNPARPVQKMNPSSFVDGKTGSALECNWNPLVVPDAPELQLAPGFAIDCWVKWEGPIQAKEQVLVKKEKEYMLRVNGHEDKTFAFFVHLAGWEPRVKGPVAQPGTWYHVVASWSGTELSLEVNGVRQAVSRPGVATPTPSPVIIGSNSGQFDELRILNPQFIRARELAARVAAVPPGERLKITHFGGNDGWKGWQGLGGAEVNAAGDRLEAKLPSGSASLILPRLEVPLGKKRYLCADIEPTGRNLALTFLTDRGLGSVNVPLWLWGEGQTAFIDLSPNAAWGGTLKALALSLPNGSALTLRNLWISEKIEGRPFLYVRSLSPGRAVLRAGREEIVHAVAGNRGAEGSQLRATLTVPTGVTILDGAAKALPTLASGSIGQTTWRLRAERAMEATVKVEFTGEGATPAAKSAVLDFTSPLSSPAIQGADLPAAVPRMKLGAYYFAGWGGKNPHDDGSPSNAWAKGMPSHFTKKLATEYSGRTPVWGWREDSMEITMRQIDLAADHGLAFFAYCWYFKDDKGPLNIQKVEENPLHEPMKMLMAAKNNKRMEFCLLIANHVGARIVGEAAWKQASDYWIEQYFSHPRYLRVDGKPLLIIYSPKEADQGGLAYLQEAATKKGFPGVLVAGCNAGAPEGGVQVRTEYNSKPSQGLSLTELHPYKYLVDHNISVWAKAELIDMPYIPVATQGWDRSPWEAKNGEGWGKGSAISAHFARGTPAEFEDYLRGMAEWMEANPGRVTKDWLGLIYAWNEIGEGGWLVPCRDDPDGAYLKAIKRVVFEK
jgi:hypothetical protein